MYNECHHMFTIRKKIGAPSNLLARFEGIGWV